MESPFDALLRAATQDPDAAEGIAHAYRSLDADARRLLRETVVRDAHRAGIEAAPILAIFLAVEDDPDVVFEIASSIAKLAGAARAWRWRDGSRGAVLMAR